MHATTTDAEEQRYAELQVIALDFARQGDTKNLEQMIRHGLPVNLADGKGQTLLMLASYHGRLQTTRMLLDLGAEVDRANDRGQTPLGGVAFKGYDEIAALLLKHGANIDADNGVGMTPIMFAAMFGRQKVLALLQARGASLRKRNRFGLSAGAMIRLAQWIRSMRLRVFSSKRARASFLRTGRVS